MLKTKRALIKKVVKLEFEMFEYVRTIQPSLCQERSETFKLMREMNHSVLSINTLKSYLEDLKTAKLSKRNLMTEKYARMNNLIPVLKLNPLIYEIVSIESKWIKEFSQKYPLIANYKPNYFKQYLSCELETYSDNSIDSYFHDIKIAEKKDRNLAQERFEYLIKKLGYSSLEDFNSKREREKKL
ncbi:MAG: DUF4125 family protein [Candidatus Heimdallarchaeota archaeon]